MKMLTLVCGESAPSIPTSEALCSPVSCGLRLSEVGLSEIRKPQVIHRRTILGYPSSGCHPDFP
jgi:hypothetical protein